MPGIIFTDLDGTLLGHEDYRFEPVLPVIRDLQAEGIRVVLSTSKTFDEVRRWWERLGLHDPFMVENGSALYLPAGDYEDHPGVLQMGAPRVCNGAFFEIVLGTPVTELMQVLAPYEGSYTSLAHCSLDEAVTLTGLTPDEARDAQARSFTLPLHLTSDEIREKLVHDAGAAGFSCQQGGRFLHLQGACNKGMALKKLMALEPARDGARPFSLALGDSGNDLDMLEAADYAVVVRSPGGHRLEPSNPNTLYTDAPAPEGWVEGVGTALVKIRAATR